MPRSPDHKVTRSSFKAHLQVLNHPNIVLYIDSALESQALLIVMEYVNGGNLHDFLMNQTELLAEDKVLNYFTQLIVALNHIHSKNVLHRDLKASLIYDHYMYDHFIGSLNYPAD